ncbi:MAG: hypothetical protein M1828_006446 [Chrysothrix sp. TS-e1954]|nr:MAG: hypothetical protein M1828_006446 [Chrysothrix sp. TS-e1954]
MGFTLEEAYNNGYGTSTLINANAVTSIDLAVSHYGGFDTVSHTHYDVTLSTIPNMDMICDISENDNEQHCYTTTFVRVPTFTQTIHIKQPVSQWTDVVAEAGAYFAFVQFLSWILSGLFWA